MPKLLARRATSGLSISSTVTSQDGHAACFTMVTVSSHTDHPALKISSVCLVAIVVSFIEGSKNWAIKNFPLSGTCHDKLCQGMFHGVECPYLVINGGDLIESTCTDIGTRGL